MTAYNVTRDLDSDIFFAAVLSPNRSLSPRGFWILMAVASSLALVIGTGFMLVGAWPVLGFCGLEIALLYWAFSANYRSGRAGEELRLTERAMEVTRISPYGREKRWRFEPTWLQVLIDEPPEHHSKLRLESHGRALEIGAFLSPEERVQLAHALRDALARWRRR